MTKACWREKREHRQGIGVICNQFSRSSILNQVNTMLFQTVTDHYSSFLDIETMENLNRLPVAPPGDLPPMRLPARAESGYYFY